MRSTLGGNDQHTLYNHTRAPWDRAHAHTLTGPFSGVTQGPAGTQK